tara:strand:+ start:429 stop:1514 length:1086 start_codon:yes stop_codon:yes gene_type:complete
MAFSLNLPVNSVSFGQVSALLLRGLYERQVNPPLFTIGGNVDLSTQTPDEGFFNWVKTLTDSAAYLHSRDNPTLKLWHFNGGMESFSNKHILLTFYELDQPTKTELNVAKSCEKLIFTNKYTQEVFKQHNIDSELVPLAFDKYNFKRLDKEYFDDGRIVFNLCGKFEKRKHHRKIIQAWIKKFGNDKRYFLQCSVYNSFLSEEQNKSIFAESVNHTKYFNVHFLGFHPTNQLYNDFLNSGDIIIGMSGGEGWGLPEFHSVAIGKHAVMLNASSYKDWISNENSVIVEPKGKIDVYDGAFFTEGSAYNQGKIFDFDEDDFISACEESIKRVESNRTNEKGLALQDEFPVSRMTNSILQICEQ